LIQQHSQQYSMKPSRGLPFALLCSVLLGGAYYAGREKPLVPVEATVETPADIRVKMAKSSRAASQSQAPAQAPESKPEAQVRSSILLTEQSFESRIHQCFEGEACELGESPEKLYQALKRRNDPQSIDRLISLMRSKLSDPDFRSRHRTELERMIEDFYPPSELPFQRAAFHSYAGENEKALEVYLDLERRSRNDPRLRPAPSLNIANVLFDLQRYSEALSYYRVALEEHRSGKQPSVAPQAREVLAAIEQRIAETERWLGR
jgi:tetratricopeptide (TPR) repeat protein